MLSCLKRERKGKKEGKGGGGGGKKANTSSIPKQVKYNLITGTNSYLNSPSVGNCHRKVRRG